jgi:D-beta-D-heptose 7-phosphate kinase/D-beta-D-heptose 1-phosphate adenosyltransferase
LIGRASHRHPHQILRVDTEVRTPLDEAWQVSMLERLERELPDFDVLLISDYAKGACPPEFLRRLIELARRYSVPVVVDPARHPDYGRYDGATVLTPNRNEASLGVGWTIETRADGIRAGGQLCERHDLDGVVVKLDGDGMVVVRRDGSSEAYPARRRAVYDVTGAGDMVLAMLGLALASGLSLEDAVELSNIAAGLEVERLGVTPVFRSELEEELRRDEALEKSCETI